MPRSPRGPSSDEPLPKRQKRNTVSSRSKLFNVFDSAGVLRFVFDLLPWIVRARLFETCVFTRNMLACDPIGRLKLILHVPHDVHSAECEMLSTRTESLQRKACFDGSSEFLQVLVDLGFVLDQKPFQVLFEQLSDFNDSGDDLATASQSSHCMALQWLLRNPNVMDRSLIYNALTRLGYLRVLKWIICNSRFYGFQRVDIHIAAKHGHVHILEWFRTFTDLDRGVVIKFLDNERVRQVADAAATYGRLEVLQWVEHTFWRVGLGYVHLAHFAGLNCQKEILDDLLTRGKIRPEWCADSYEWATAAIQTKNVDFMRFMVARRFKVASLETEHEENLRLNSKEGGPFYAVVMPGHVKDFMEAVNFFGLSEFFEYFLEFGYKFAVDAGGGTYTRDILAWSKPGNRGMLKSWLRHVGFRNVIEYALESPRDCIMAGDAYDLIGLIVCGGYDCVLQEMEKRDWWCRVNVFEIAKRAVQEGDWRIITWFVDNKCITAESQDLSDIGIAACKYNHVHILEYLWNKLEFKPGHKFYCQDGSRIAAYHGHLEILKFMHENGAAHWEVGTYPAYETAVLNQQLHVIQWYFESDCRSHIEHYVEDLADALEERSSLHGTRMHCFLLSKINR